MNVVASVVWRVKLDNEIDSRNLVLLVNNNGSIT